MEGQAELESDLDGAPVCGRGWAKPSLALLALTHVPPQTLARWLLISELSAQGPPPPGSLP